MKSRERGNIWPVISVAAGAFFVLVIVPLATPNERAHGYGRSPSYYRRRWI
jgi:hypothetical protein